MHIRVDRLRDCDRHGLGLKPTRIILLCPWKRHLTALFLLIGLEKQFFVLVIFL